MPSAADDPHTHNSASPGADNRTASAVNTATAPDSKGKAMATKAERFPSRFFRVEDVRGKTIKTAITDFRMETLMEGEREKPVLTLADHEPEFVLNLTNYDTLADAYGDDDNWIGKPLELCVEKVLFKGKRVESIRVRIPKQPPRQSVRPTPPAEDPPFDDDRSDFVP
jgi:hypothetical protein